MNEEQKVAQSDELAKSIDTLLDEVFSDETSTDSVEKSIDISNDSQKTADEALKKVPAGQKDESRGAGRPKQISDVPQNDMDGRRDSEYDDSISENDGKEDEPEEAKKQAQSMDQTSEKNRMGSKPNSPKMAPFKKSEEMSEEEYKEFEEFKKAKAEAAEKAKESEDLKKAEVAKKEQEDLIKSAVKEATNQMVKENEELRKAFNETQALIKAMASQPVQRKSITSIEALEKSDREDANGPEAFSKSEVLDAAMDLVKAGKISDLVVSEIEMTNVCSDPEAKAAIEKHLERKN